MKTIAVMTDFSSRATNAARYALHLAQHIQANVLLYNVFFVPSVEPLSAQVAWPMEDFDDTKSHSKEELQKLTNKLKDELAALPEDAFRPAIVGRCHEGAFTLPLDELLDDDEIILLVMANHHKGFTTLITGNHTRQILDKTTLPVLIVPEQVHFNSIQKIVFATDLNTGDLEVINSLTGIAWPFCAEITLAHICPLGSVHLVNAFLQEVGNKINYPNIYYRNVCKRQVRNGLKELEKDTDADMLVMVHRNKSFIGQIWNGSYTQKTAANVQIPLLVYPHTTQSLPVF